jgi:hypothetical protein
VKDLKIIAEAVHRALSDRKMEALFESIKNIKRRADYWDLADVYFRKYGHNFRNRIWKDGSWEDSQKLANIENKMFM